MAHSHEHDHEHEHEHADSCGCGHDHDHDHADACGCDDELEERGCGCGCGHDHDGEHDEEAERRERLFLGASGVLLLIGLIAEHIVHAEFVANANFILSAIAGLIFIGPKALASIRRRTADMNVLMSIAVIGGLFMGAFGEAAMVIFLYQVGEWLEDWSMDKTRSSIRELMDLSPAQAHVVGADGKTTDVALAEVEEGATIRVLAGERVPLDGEIVSGSSSFDESPVTGESLPRDKGAGEEVYGGSLNTSGVVEVRVSADEDCSTIARIISMVEGAQRRKAPYESFINRFAEVYTPIVIGVAIVVALVVPAVLGLFRGFDTIVWRDWIYRALSLLVVACPCALVISTPVSFVSAITRAANSGVLVKGGSCFDIACGISHVAFDKTGTLTRGMPEVVDVRAFFGADENAVLACAAALETNSTHPIARAITARTTELGLELPEATDVREIAGHGLAGIVSGSECAIGKPAFIAEQCELAQELEAAVREVAASGATALVLMAGGVPLGVIGVADALRPSATEAIAEFHELGVENTEMLTGDNAQTAAAIASAAGLSTTSAELLPEDKLARIREIQAAGERVCMVGDGINDAPALAAADLGATIGARASDTALEVAEIAVLSDDLSKLSGFFRLARRTMNIVRENIAFAIGIKALIMILVIAGVAGMGAAVFADTGVSLIVILNGMRLMRESKSAW